jgi:hypothetical protein
MAVGRHPGHLDPELDRSALRPGLRARGGSGVVGSGGRPASHHPAQEGAGLGTDAAQGLAVHGHIDDRQAGVRQGIGCR